MNTKDKKWDEEDKKWEKEVKAYFNSEGDPVSELTPCNYCNMKVIKKEAGLRGHVITKLGQDVFIHPLGIDIEHLTEKERNKYWRAWMMAITDHCVC